MTLSNQISDAEHYSATIDFGKAAYNRRTTHRVFDKDTTDFSWSYSAFILHEELTDVTPTCQYVKYNCIFVRVQVQ